MRVQAYEHFHHYIEVAAKRLHEGCGAVCMHTCEGDACLRHGHVDPTAAIVICQFSTLSFHAFTVKQCSGFRWVGPTLHSCTSCVRMPAQRLPDRGGHGCRELQPGNVVPGNDERDQQRRGHREAIADAPGACLSVDAGLWIRTRRAGTGARAWARARARAGAGRWRRAWTGRRRRRRRRRGRRAHDRDLVAQSRLVSDPILDSTSYSVSHSISCTQMAPPA